MCNITEDGIPQIKLSFCMWVGFSSFSKENGLSCLSKGIQLSWFRKWILILQQQSFRIYYDQGWSRGNSCCYECHVLIETNLVQVITSFFNSHLHITPIILSDCCIRLWDVCLELIFAIITLLPECNDLCCAMCNFSYFLKWVLQDIAIAGFCKEGKWNEISKERMINAIFFVYFIY
jgi:hypothetical protein